MLMSVNNNIVAVFLLTLIYSTQSLPISNNQLSNWAYGIGSLSSQSNEGSRSVDREMSKRSVIVPQRDIRGPFETMRFGKRAPFETMRFGKRAPFETMRFGKRAPFETMRFGKRQMDEMPFQTMRFGKK